VKGLVVALVVVVGVIVGVLMYVDRIAETAIERGGTHALGVQTRVGSLSIGLVSGRFSISGLNVANPEGFEADHFLDLSQGTVGLRIRQLLVDPISVRSIELDGIDVNLERRGRTTNYGVILDNLAALGSAGEAESEAVDPGEARGFVIHEVVIRNVSAHVQLAPGGGKATRLDVEVPEVRLEQLGGGSANGVQMSEVASILTRAVLRAIAEKGDVLPGDLTRDLRAGLGRVDRVAGRIPVVGDPGSAAGATQELQDKAKDALEGLLGR
jgi:hypothetical protein